MLEESQQPSGTTVHESHTPVVQKSEPVKEKGKPGRKAKVKDANSEDRSTKKYFVLNEEDKTYREISQDELAAATLDTIKSSNLRIIGGFEGVIEPPRITFGQTK
jgi:hypothetical protein